jgi:hypothetical protein
VEISERARVVGSETVAFINSVAALDTRIFNRIFGEKLFSLRTVGMSTTLSVSVLLLVVAAIERGTSPQDFWSKPTYRINSLWQATF